MTPCPKLSAPIVSPELRKCKTFISKTERVGQSEIKKLKGTHSKEKFTARVHSRLDTFCKKISQILKAIFCCFCLKEELAIDLELDGQNNEDKKLLSYEN